MVPCSYHRKGAMKNILQEFVLVLSSETISFFSFFSFIVPFSWLLVVDAIVTLQRHACETELDPWTRVPLSWYVHTIPEP